jgi:MFS family permease
MTGLEPSGEGAGALRGTRSGGYLAVLLIVTSASVASAAFDSVARNVALPAILDELGMSVGEAGLITTLSFVVSFLASVLLGRTMDRFGRKPGLLVSLGATVMVSGATAFVTSVWQFFLVGALAGVCLAVQSPAEVLVSEEAPARLRGILTGVVNASFPLGAIIVGLAGALVLPGGHWRLLFLLGASPVIVLVVAVFVLREPVRPRSLNIGTVDPSAFVQIFAPDLRRQTLAICLSGFLAGVGNVFVLNLGVTYLVKYERLGIATASLGVAVTGFAACAGLLIWGLCSDYIQPRIVFVCTSIIGGLAVLSLADHGGAAVSFVSLALFGFFGNASLGIFYRYATDAFPTRARGTGTSFVVGVAFLGSAIWPAILGWLMGSQHYVATVVMAGGVTILGSLVMLTARAIPARFELSDL